MSDLRKKVQRRLLADTEWWRPTEGEMLIAQYVGQFTYTHDEYGTSTVLRLWDGRKEYLWLVAATAAKNDLEGMESSHGLHFGDWLGIVYKGRSGSSPTAPHIYRLVWEPGDGNGLESLPEGEGPDLPVVSTPDRPTPQQHQAHRDRRDAPPPAEQAPDLTDELGNGKIVAAFNEDLDRDSKKEFLERFGKPTDNQYNEEAWKFIRERGKPF